MTETRVKLQVLSKFEDIAARIDFNIVLRYFTKKNKFKSKAVVERINKKPTPVERCRYLLLYLMRGSSTNPYLDFREALNECGYSELIQAIDDEEPVIYQCPSPSKFSMTTTMITNYK